MCEELVKDSVNETALDREIIALYRLCVLSQFGVLYAGMTIAWGVDGYEMYESLSVREVFHGQEHPGGFFVRLSLVALHGGDSTCAQDTFVRVG